MTEPIVSVVAATYRPGPGLDRLVNSLDRQTLSPERFEVILVDDGSPDDTFETLRGLERSRSNYRVAQIPNSGWPSRPRNVGIDMARGRYVAFMDHDDELYPDALRAATAFADITGADIVNGKEARTNDASWALQTYLENADNVAHAPGRYHPLIPTNPHKLYRREFLIEYGIRFPEGTRVLWEDIFFNVSAARHARVISTLADTPYYHWVVTKGSGSTTFRRDREEWWLSLQAVFAAIDGELAGIEPDHDQLILHQYASRVLPTFNSTFTSRPTAIQEMLLQRSRDIIAAHVPARFDDLLTPTQRARAILLRDGRDDELRLLTDFDRDPVGSGKASAFCWVDGRLLVNATATWTHPYGAGWVQNDGGRLRKAIPPEVGWHLAQETLDVTDEVSSARAGLGIRSRADRMVWMLPTIATSEPTFVPESGETVIELSAELDVTTAAMGRALEDGVWDVNCRCEMGLRVQQTPLKTSFSAGQAVVDGRLINAYANKDGALSIDINESVRPFLSDVDFGSVQQSDEGVTITLPGVHVAHTGPRVLREYDVVVAGSLSHRLARTRRLSRWPRLERPMQRFATDRRGSSAALRVNTNGAVVLTLTVPNPQGGIVLYGTGDEKHVLIASLAISVDASGELAAAHG